MLLRNKPFFLERLYPTYPEVSSFKILQFIANLALECKFLVYVLDGSDVSRIYLAVYGKSYYEYHFKGIDLSQKFLFQKIVVEKKTFLECFEEKIRRLIRYLSKLSSQENSWEFGGFISN